MIGIRRADFLGSIVSLALLGNSVSTRPKLLRVSAAETDENWTLFYSRLGWHSMAKMRSLHGAWCRSVASYSKLGEKVCVQEKTRRKNSAPGLIGNQKDNYHWESFSKFAGTNLSY